MYMCNEHGQSWPKCVNFQGLVHLIPFQLTFSQNVVFRACVVWPNIAYFHRFGYPSLW